MRWRKNKDGIKCNKNLSIIHFATFIKRILVEDGGGVRGRGVHLCLWIHQEYTFRHRSACRTPAEKQTGVPDQRRRIYGTTQNSVG